MRDSCSDSSCTLQAFKLFHMFKYTDLWNCEVNLIPKWLALVSLVKDIVLQVLGTCLYSLQRCISLLDHSDLILDPETAADASDMLKLHIKSYCWLASFYYNQRQMLFRIRPKMHYMWHQVVQIREWRLNIGIFATWDDETFLGKSKLLQFPAMEKPWQTEFMIGICYALRC